MAKTKIDLVVEKINNKINKGGPPVVFRATDVKDPKIVRRPTGIATLDLALAGGFPGSTICAISGKEGAGKDALLNCIFRTHQLFYGDRTQIYMNHNEPGGFDKLWARKHGVKIGLSDYEINDYEKAHGEKFPATYKSSLQEGLGEFLLSDSKSAEEVFTSVLACGEAGIPLMVINSLTNLIPEVQLDEADMEKVGEKSGKAGMDQAKVITQFCKRWGRGAEGKVWYPTLLVVQQARANLGFKTWGSKDYTTNTGAYALRHAKSMDLELRTVERITEGDKIIGTKVAWTLTKGKHGTHQGKTGSFNLIFNSGIQREDNLVDAMVETKVAESPRKDVVVLPDGTRASRSDAVALLASDQNLFVEMYKRVMMTMPTRVLYEEPR